MIKPYITNPVELKLKTYAQCKSKKKSILSTLKQQIYNLRLVSHEDEKI